jgi:penicillin amidase
MPREIDLWRKRGLGVLAPYFASIAAMDSQTFDEFRDCMKRWAVPTVNQVYADTDGNIGWVPVARYPVRRNWDGLLPVPGDGRFEWDRFDTSEQLPCSFNPPDGFRALANEMNIPLAWSAVNSSIG